MPQISVTRTPLSDEEKRARCQRLIGFLIVEVDPERRAVEPLAKKIGVSRQHLTVAISRGRCSREVANRLQKMFGREKAPADELCWSKLS